MCCKWAEKKVEKLGFWGVKLKELAAAAIALMVAKLWMGLLHLDWYWYLVIFVVALIYPVVRMFKK